MTQVNCVCGIKIESIKKLLADYGCVNNAHRPAQAGESQVALFPIIKGVALPEPAQTKKALIEAEIASMLSDRDSIHRSKVLERLLSKGLMGKEKNPMQALAVYMASFNKFEGDGRGNWKLKEVLVHSHQAT